MDSGNPTPDGPEGLKAILLQLREELARTRAGDDTTQAKLDALAEQVGTLLDEEAPATAEAHQSLGSRLKEELAALEEDHPTLAYTIGQVIETLSGLGI